MQSTLHYSLLCTQLTFSRLVMQSLESSGLTTGQPKVLDYLLDHDGCMQKELAAACMVDAATLVGLLNRMEDSGLLERRQLGNNRRSFYVYLTDLGREKAACVKDAFAEIEEQAFSNFSAEERQTLIDGLWQLRNNLLEKRHTHE